MILERMNELLLLIKFYDICKYDDEIICNFNDKKYDGKKLRERFEQLLEEFLEEYKINEKEYEKT